MNLKYLSILTIPLLAWGCATGLRTKGGSSRHVAQTGAVTEVTQSENPKEPTTSSTTSVVSEETILPAGTTIETISVDFPPKTKLHTKAEAKTNITRITISEPTPLKRTISDGTIIRQGGSWKDTVGEVVAKMSAAKPIQILGAIICLLGAGMFTPWARPIIGSSSTPIITIGIGISLVALPYIIVGNEGKITGALAGLAAIPILWWLAHRHGSHSTKAKIYEEFIDANKNGIDDREETKNQP